MGEKRLEKLRNEKNMGYLEESKMLAAAAGALSVKAEDIHDIKSLKKGMTNHSFLFSCHGERYIMRMPGEGTGRLIDREQEAVAYHAIYGKQLCDDPVYLDAKSGYKITKYIEGARVCNPDDSNDLKKCMDKLRGLHKLRIQVPHTFDIFERIEFYESLWEGNPSCYQDYEQTKQEVFALRDYIASCQAEYCLTHIDAVPDNFLFSEDAQGKEVLQLIDWEYAGMQDPHVDIAMFCIYAMYDKAQIDRLISFYFIEGCEDETRIKIYCYIAACGLLWSNWCEYKRKLGVEFGEYSLCQYRFAKDYCRIVQEELKR